MFSFREGPHIMVPTSIQVYFSSFCTDLEKSLTEGLFLNHIGIFSMKEGTFATKVVLEDLGAI